jgi:hypothetical protein
VGDAVVEHVSHETIPQGRMVMAVVQGSGTREEVNVGGAVGGEEERA